MRPKRYFWRGSINEACNQVLLTAIDPDLIIYDVNDWKVRQADVFARARSLALHREINRNYGQAIAMSDELSAMVYQSFPWSHIYKNIGALRDLRQFMFEDLSRSFTVTHHIRSHNVCLRPADLTCTSAPASSVRNCWKELLSACIEQINTLGIDVQVATCESAVESAHCDELVVSIVSHSKATDHTLPLVWDRASWHRRLSFQDFWPDLPRCVELYFQSNVAIFNWKATSKPIGFECTDEFWQSVHRLCQPLMRHLLVKAVTKRVYGIRDAALHDEALGALRRFRVTRFWRVHYRDYGDRIVLDEFGPHDMCL